MNDFLIDLILRTNWECNYIWFTYFMGLFDMVVANPELRKEARKPWVLDGRKVIKNCITRRIKRTAADEQFRDVLLGGDGFPVRGTGV